MQGQSRWRLDSTLTILRPGPPATHRQPLTRDAGKTPRTPLIENYSDLRLRQADNRPSTRWTHFSSKGPPKWLDPLVSKTFVCGTNATLNSWVSRKRPEVQPSITRPSNVQHLSTYQAESPGAVRRRRVGACSGCIRDKCTAVPLSRTRRTPLRLSPSPFAKSGLPTPHCAPCPHGKDLAPIPFTNSTQAGSALAGRWLGFPCKRASDWGHVA